MSSPYIHFYDLGDKCQQCGATDNLDIHHKDGNRKNNAIENLVLLCHRCHMQKHLKKSETKPFIVQFPCPKGLVDAFDEKLEKEGYASRSELLRKFMRDYIEAPKSL